MTAPADSATEAPPLRRSGAVLPRAGIVHLGLGAFFRAHGAIYVAEAMALADRGSAGRNECGFGVEGSDEWGIIGVSLQNPDMRDRLAPQGFAYTALELGPDGEIPRVIEVIRDVLVAREDPGAVLAAMADPCIRIVTLTVTEKGYCHDPATGRLNMAHPDIIHDVANALPWSAPGFLVRALAMRRAAGVRPFTVLTCDNLPTNGRLVRRIVLDLALAIDPEDRNAGHGNPGHDDAGPVGTGLADWIAAEGRFPCTMVDRIVPATKPEDVARVADLTGRQDAAPVLHEPFRQWVIEDDFVGGARPDFAPVGVQLVTDVTAFEHMKLRMLNGTHSSLAYLGYLAGHQTVADTVADPVFARFVQRLWATEIIPALQAPPGASLPDYAAALLARFANPVIRHRTWQIAMDGSQKLPQRILGTLAENHAAGRHSPGLTLAVAAWMRYVGGVDEAGQPIEVKDPLAARMRALSDAAVGPAAKVSALLSLRDVFSPAQARMLAPGVIAATARLLAVGARAAAAEVAP